MTNVHKYISIIALTVGLAACASDADLASRNISLDADNFKINRRIIFYNGITNDFILVIEGLCAHVQEPKKLAVTCKVSPTEYKKHFLGISDNVTYFSEQLKSSQVSTYYYRVIFKPSIIIPDIEVR